MEVFAFQLCDRHGRNRLIDRITVDFNDGVEWVKKMYSWCTEWRFAKNPDGNYDMTDVIDKEAERFFYMIGLSERRSDVHILVEKRNLH